MPGPTVPERGEHDNASVLRRLSAAVAHGDLDTVADLLHPDATWEPGGPVAEPGVHLGRDRVVRLLAHQLEAAGTSLHTEPIEVLATDWGAVELRHVGGRSAGRTVDRLELVGCEIVDGRVTRVIGPLHPGP